MMKKKMELLFIIAQVAQVTFCWHLEASWLDRKAEGWAWYEDKEEPNVQIEKPEAMLMPIPLKTASEQVAEAKEELEEKLAEALINPTEENLVIYMNEQRKRLHQSAAFAHAWEKVLLQRPDLDPTASSYPVNHYGIQLQREIDREKTRKFISELSKINGLFFFYEGKSLISQGVSGIIKKFSERYNWEVTAISVDGAFLDGFSTSRADNGISKELGISFFPALFVFDPKEKEATPIAYGVVSLDQIEERIILQFQPTTPTQEE